MVISDHFGGGTGDSVGGSAAQRPPPLINPYIVQADALGVQLPGEVIDKMQ